jgi:DNA-binding HxlR family transcriptional regulator
MNKAGGYEQFCPVSMAAEVVCTRWTPLILREFFCGTTRFNDLRRGVPKMSPALLSKRLKELEATGVITTNLGAGGTPEYRLTEMGRELEPTIMALGTWGHRWIESSISLKNLDPSLLMWDMRRHLNPKPLPDRRCTIQFLYPELGAGDRDWWLVVSEGLVDLCKIDPGYDTDLLITAPLRSMTAVWMGIATISSEIDAGRITLDGDRRVAQAIGEWLGLSPFAREPRRVA